MAFFQRNAVSSRSGSTKSRRPRGVSRRQRKRQLGFETLEDRRVMSADSSLVALQGAVADDIQLQVQSYSSATPEGQAQILLNELYWQSLLGSASQSNIQTLSIPTDPLSGYQWQLINTGQEVGSPDFQPIYGVPGEDINVAPLWNLGLTGAGVTVAVIDSGIEKDHPDLAANISTTLELDALTGDGDASPNLLDPAAAHGTAVAGLIGAVADNGLGGTGVAPGVEIVPIRLIDVGQTEQAFINAFRFANDQIDITNNSWGPFIDTNEDGIPERGIAGPSPGELLALRDSIVFGRTDPVTGENLGVIHVFATGNDAGTPFAYGFESIGSWDSATYNGWVSSRYTIGVTGVDHDGFYNNVDGTVTGYAETGPNVLVAAPTGSNVRLNIAGDTGLGSGIWTTDFVGESGYNGSDNTGPPFGDRDFLEDIDYTSRFNGTSASAPLVSGVIALMLEANPNLSWRDVQEILVRSARQNAKFDVPETGSFDFASTQNTWIINQTPVFPGIDFWDPAIDPFLQTLNPTVVPTPQVLTNGAGYTVSQGRGVHGEEIGYAHGVVDAELAVQLAQQWTTKNQKLPDELTYTSFISPSGGWFYNLPAQEVTNEDAGYQTVPGGFGGEDGFIGLWNEYFEDEPFSDNPTFPFRGGYVPFSVPDNNTMSIETVEVKISLVDNADNDQFLENVRVLLVSPDGTHSELNNFFYERPGETFALPITYGDASFEESGELDALTVNTDPTDAMVLTFSTNRNWGERSDDRLVFDPTTGEPVAGGSLEQGWQLHFENYSNTAFEIVGMEIAWHGSPIGANTERVQGLIGIDDNRDDLFNYSRVIQEINEIDGDPSTLRYGEVVNTIDLTHESMGANITVFAHRDVNANGILDGSDILVDQFVTGADGNYYFDLVPDDYIISIEDPLGRTAVDDSLTPAGFLQDYKTEWAITSDFFKVWDYDANLEVPLQADGTPFAFLDGDGDEIVYGIKNLNFLLDPGAPVAPQVDFSGVVFADINGDGLFNGDDVHVPEVSVYVDANRNGQYDAGEVLASTDSNGEYSLTVPNYAATVVNVGVIVPPNWVASDPAEAFSPFFVEAGDDFTGVDFAITPPVGTGPGNGTSQPGYLLGVVYEDVSGDGARQASEPGQPGIDVFIDSNGSGSYEIGEKITTTNVNGAFIFSNMAPGSHIVRIETAPPFEQINPGPGGAQVVALAGGGTVSDILFGVGNTAILDFGDLPSMYGVTLLAEDGARHAKGVYYLGTMSNDVDAELDGQPSDDALGDDNTGYADEDGIVVDTLVEGTTGRLVATASRYGGYLQGWIDFNGDGDFDDVGERIITNELLMPGDNEVFFDIPATIEGSRIFARFRYGEYGIDSVTGLALIGEVEDYELTPPPPAQFANGPDFDNDGDIDGFDFLAWQLGFGMTGNATPANGDANGDETVDVEDLNEWSAGFGGGVAQASAPGPGSDDESGSPESQNLSVVTAAFAETTDDEQDGLADEIPLVAIAEETQAVPAPLFATEVAPVAVASPVLFASASPVSSDAAILGPQLPEKPETTGQTPSAAAATIAPSVAFVESEIRPNTFFTLASTRPSAEDVGLARLQRRVASTRFELQSFDTTLRYTADVADVGFALRDRALDHLFAKRQRPAELVETLRGNEGNESDAEEAFALALGEEIDWRFG